MTSIKRFLILLSLASVTLVNFIAALHGYRTGLTQTEQLLDQQLVEKALLLSTQSTSETKDYEANHFLFQILDGEGNLLRASENATRTPIANKVNGLSTISYNGHLWRTYQLETGSAGTRILVAEEISNRYSVAESIILQTVSPVVLALLVLAIIIWVVVTLGLYPIKQLTREVSRKQPQSLSPIAVKNLPKELHPLLLAMNNLLGRLEASFEREQRFSSDAAHELRTPLSALKINLFNLTRKLEHSDEDLQDMNRSIDRMGHLIEQLLVLYRMTSEQTKADFKKTDLYEIARQVIAENYSKFDEKNQVIELAGHSTWITGNEFALSALVKNLIDNASKYTPKSGNIKVSVTNRDNNACLIIEDSGIGIPAELTGRVFDRFYRVSPDGGVTDAPGCGLGLSIVKHIVDMHEATIFLGHSHFDSGLQVEIIFPITAEDRQ